MTEYNEPFFRLYENLFLVLKQDLGKRKALKLFRKVMEKGLKEAFDSMGFQKGNPQDFARIIGERESSLGLDTRFPEVSENKIVYQFHRDPIPNLKGHVDNQKIDKTYMKFKVRYLLGKDWGYRTTKHIWYGDKFTEHVNRKKG
ncbi:MAG: hypothetical protein JSV39_01215 [Candidatus Aenigmatarchaeota archaeon]|nr:MAG: hypothetical protein JSV39_01215 [Candidatus Aenigmarchaeota archaeon]